MERDRLLKLIEVYTSGKATLQEREEFHKLYSEIASRPANYPEREDIVELNMLTRLLHEFDATNRSQDLKNAVVEEFGAKNNGKRVFRWSIAAAALGAFLAITFYFFRDSSDSSSVDIEQLATAIKPGENRAVLILDNGREIQLSPEHSGIVVDESIRYANGEPISTEFDPSRDQSFIANKWITLRTPLGGEYTVTLSDGTKVWLNAGSTLRYPVQFGSEDRTVNLEGEAYFQVKSIGTSSGGVGERSRFYVNTAYQKIEVLGTSFNINAYEDEHTVRTTLVEGSVVLHAEGTGIATELKPGQQAVLDKQGTVKVEEVNTENFTSWKDGKINLEGKTFDEVMRELGRWYDLDIVYEGDIPQKSFYGAAYRSSQLSIVIRLLRSADVDFRLEGRQLIIQSPTVN